MKLSLRNNYPTNVFSNLVDDWFQPHSLNKNNSINTFEPAIDVKENEKSILLLAELPGLNKEDIEISIEKNVLTLKGEKKKEETKENENYSWTERSYGQFQRSFKLPYAVEINSIQAKFKEGILKVEIPRSEKEKAQKIEIK